MRRAAEERQKQEDEEAAKWMGMISVEKEGTGRSPSTLTFTCPGQTQSHSVHTTYFTGVGPIIAPGRGAACAVVA